MRSDWVAMSMKNDFLMTRKLFNSIQPNFFLIRYVPSNRCFSTALLKQSFALFKQLETLKKKWREIYFLYSRYFNFFF